MEYEQEDVVKFAGMLGMSENVHFQNHCKAVLLDYELGFFAGTNDLVTKIGGSPPVTLEQFVESPRGAFV